jgi:hypothetical protein
LLGLAATEQAPELITDLRNALLGHERFPFTAGLVPYELSATWDTDAQRSR